MKSRELLVAVVMAGLCASASVPIVSNVTTAQNSARRVTVNYTLSGEPGIVTLCVQTNRGDGVWIDVDDANLSHVSGDANRVVPVGDHALSWLPHKSWPGQLITGGNIRVGVKAWATNAPPDYMVMSLVSSRTVEFYTSAAMIPFGVTNDLYKTDYLVMRKIPAANVRWRMGSPDTPPENGRKAARETPHEVMLTNDYYIGIYPVTQRQYQRIKNARPAYFGLDADYMTRPVEQVRYEGVRGAASAGYNWPTDGHKVLGESFMGLLRTLTGVDGLDLPTEAQWEFACRAGCGAALYSGKELESTTTSVNLNPLARYAGNGGKSGGTSPAATCTAANGTAKVGSYEPNAWGLYDMLGNVWEWCLDWYQESQLGYDPETGPVLPAASSPRVIRGGGWSTEASNCRSAYRAGYMPSNYIYDGVYGGFRVACPAAVR